ncbi:MAG TPA: hypothetical protein VLC09_14140, partial [Polyangiaceae bacterium]|nr:hypothetical protein [Polyangiaceae bacterium]
MLALSLGCAAAPAPAPKAPAPSNEELSRLRAENEALVRRVEELEAERDRLRAKAEPMAVLAEAPAQGEEAVEEAAEGASTVPVVAGLPVVKLVPNPRASGSEAVEAETPEARPVLRV